MPISIVDLRERVSVATRGTSAEQAHHNRARRAQAKRLQEASNAEVMFTVSRMSRMIGDFPEHIAPIDLNFRSGVWRKGDNHTVLLRGQAAIVRTVLDALEIGAVDGAVEAVIDVVGWKVETLADDLVAAAARLPDHVVDAFFRLQLEDFAAAFGLPLSDVPADQIAQAAYRLSVSFAEGEPWSHLSRLATPTSLPYLEALLSRGVPADASALVTAASYYDIGLVDVLLTAGTSINAVGGVRRESALHVAVLGAVTPAHSEEAIGFARALIERGIDLDIENKDGDTAIDVLGEKIDTAYGTGNDSRLDMMLVEELFGIMKHAAKAAAALKP